MNDDVLLVERRALPGGGVDWLTMNRPRSHNALDTALIFALTDYFEAAASDDEVRVVVLRGNGPSFCAGLDLRTQLSGDTRGNHRLPDLIPAMRNCPQTIVSLVHGAACGGGFVMALASDIRIAAESARMEDAFIRIGLSGCDIGISYFLPRLVGLSVASELMMTGRVLDASRAERLGLVSEVVADDALSAAGEAMVEELLRASVLGLRRTKEILNRALAIDDLPSMIALEIATQVEVQHRDPAFNKNLDRYGDTK